MNPIINRLTCYCGSTLLTARMRNKWEPLKRPVFQKKQTLNLLKERTASVTIQNR